MILLTGDILYEVAGVLNVYLKLAQAG